MAWKPKTIAGKILKGAVIAGGSVLGLATGTKLFGAAGGVLKTAVNTVKDMKTAKGTTTFAAVGKTITSGITGYVDKVKEGAINLVAGTTKEQRDIIKSFKERTRDEQEKLNAIEKMVNAGATPAEARAAVGLAPEELTSYEGEKIQSAGMFDFLQNKNILYAGAALLGLALLLKRRR